MLITCLNDNVLDILIYIRYIINFTNFSLFLSDHSEI